MKSRQATADRGRRQKVNKKMKLTKKQIDVIIENTKKELKGTSKSIYTELGYFRRCDANWSYVAGWTYNGDLVVTRFGEVL